MEQSVEKISKLVAVYARVSTANQENEGTIETQLTEIKDFVQKKGLTIVKTYKDEGWSGDIIARPQLDLLRQEAKEKLWEAVITYDPSRIARRYSYQELVVDELQEAGIEVIFTTIETPKNYEDKILHGVRGLFAEYERAKITERFRLGKIRKAKEGHIIATEAPYGYTFIPKQGKPGDVGFKQGHYVIKEDEARVVKMIFSWIADEGITIRSVVKRLQERKILPRKSRRGVWGTGTLSTLLRNKSYIGRAYFSKSYAVVPNKPLKVSGYKKVKKTSRRIKPEKDWIPISVPSIINENLFNRAQKQLAENFMKSRRNMKNQYLLSGSIWCSCGKRRAGEGPQHGKYLYYRCTDRVSSFPLPPKCGERGINARIADRLVWDKILSLMSSPELLQRQLKKWDEKKIHKKHEAVNSVDDIKKEITKLRSEEDRYNKAYGAGIFTIEKLRDYIAPIREKINTHELEISKINQQSAKTETQFPTIAELVTFSQAAKITLQSLNFEEKRAIVMNVVEKAVGNQNEINVTGSIPLNNSYVGYKTIHRYRGAPQCREVHAL